MGAALAAALGLAASSASAQGRVPAGGAPWVPTLSLDSSSMPTIEGTVVPRAGEVQFGLALEWLDAAARARVGDRATTVIDGRFLSTIGAQVGLGRGWSLGLQLPALAYQSADATAVSTAGTLSPGLGDVRALVRWSLRSVGTATGPTVPVGNAGCQGRCSHNWSTGFALDLALTAPTADAPLAGYGAPTARLGATFQVRSYRYELNLAAAYLLRADGAWPAQSAPCGSPGAACLADTALRDRAVLSVGLRHPLSALLGILGAFEPTFADVGTLLAFITENTVGTPYVSFVASLDGRDPFGAPSALELGFGSQRRIGAFTVTAGGAVGFGELLQGGYRVVVGLQWQAPGDEDRDGVGDDEDRCLGVPGPASSRGCPAPEGDLDHDGLLFPADRCPTLAEDLNGVDDHDGCPDADGDADGVPDARDACPALAAGEHPDRARRGCPRDPAHSPDAPTSREGEPYAHEIR